jgi:hypothetical protein
MKFSDIMRNTETSQVWLGMEIALPVQFWSEKFRQHDQQPAEYLNTLSQKILVTTQSSKPHNPAPSNWIITVNFTEKYYYCSPYL